LTLEKSEKKKLKKRKKNKLLSYFFIGGIKMKITLYNKKLNKLEIVLSAKSLEFFSDYIIIYLFDNTPKIIQTKNYSVSYIETVLKEVK
jgi:hypothetical protein